jgi:small subunit ribosomal protein S8
MATNDSLAAALSKIQNASKVGKTEVDIQTSSKMIMKVLDLMNEHNLVGTYEKLEIGLKLNLIGKINSCNVIKPRFAVKAKDFERFEKRFLPAKDFGFLIVSTNKGIIVHGEAKKNNVGGKLVAYCY